MLKTRFLSITLTIALLTGLVGFAAPAAAESTASATATTAATTATASAGYSLPEDKTVYASAAMLVNLGSSAAHDVILYEKQADSVHAPGAMMRYMVLTYALHRVHQEGIDIDTASGTYTQDIYDRYVAGTGVPTANMTYGETWSVRDLMTAAFIQNACDAVNVLAVAIDGSVPAFVKGMNALTEELGCDYSHFANVTGLDSLSQYTTPRDMVKIIRYGQTFSEFESVASPVQYTVNPLSGGSTHKLVSANSMYSSASPFYYTPLVFSRTGLSDREGRTCASVARDSGYEYLAVVMGCPEQNDAGESGLHYRDTRTLLRWAFNDFSHMPVLAKSEILASVKVRLSWSTDHINLVPASEFATVTESRLDPTQIIKKVTVYDKTVDAPVTKGTVMGKVELIINVDQKLGEVDLVASESINRNWLLFALSGLAEFFTSPWFWAGIGLLVLLLVGYIILNIVHNRRRRRIKSQK